VQAEAPFVAVAGSIAVGKSGFVSSLSGALGSAALPEEIEANPFFERFYEDPARWSFHSQMAFVADALYRQANAPVAAPVVQDRTVYESLDVFCRILHREGNLTDADLSVFSRLRDVALALPRQPTLLIYLHAPTEAIMERIAERGRPAEQGITSDYIDALNDSYAEFARAWEMSPVLTIDTADVDLRTSSGMKAAIAELEKYGGTAE